MAPMCKYASCCKRNLLLNNDLSRRGFGSEGTGPVGSLTKVGSESKLGEWGYYFVTVANLCRVLLRPDPDWSGFVTLRCLGVPSIKPGL